MYNNMKNKLKTTLLATLIVAMFVRFSGANVAEAAKEPPTYDRNITDYLETVLQQTGTTVTTEETSDGQVLVTTNILTEVSASEYTLSTVTTMNGEILNDEEFTIILNSDGTYRLINTERGIDQTFTTNPSMTRGSASNSYTSGIVVLTDREYASDGEIISLSDEYRKYTNARFVAAVNTAGNTVVDWQTNNLFWSYHIIALEFDYLKVKHEGQTETSDNINSVMSLSNSNGDGWYKVEIRIYYSR